MNSVSTLSIAIASSNVPVATGFAASATDGAQPFAAILAPFDVATTAAIRQRPAIPGNALPPRDADREVADSVFVPIPTTTAVAEPYRVARHFAPTSPTTAPPEPHCASRQFAPMVPAVPVFETPKPQTDIVAPLEDDTRNIDSAPEQGRDRDDESDDSGNLRDVLLIAPTIAQPVVSTLPAADAVIASVSLRPAPVFDRPAPPSALSFDTPVDSPRPARTTPKDVAPIVSGTTTETDLAVATGVRHNAVQRSSPAVVAKAIGATEASTPPFAPTPVTTGPAPSPVPLATVDSRAERPAIASVLPDLTQAPDSRSRPVRRLVTPQPGDVAIASQPPRRANPPSPAFTPARFTPPVLVARSAMPGSIGASAPPLTLRQQIAAQPAGSPPANRFVSPAPQSSGNVEIVAPAAFPPVDEQVLPRAALVASGLNATYPSQRPVTAPSITMPAMPPALPPAAEPAPDPNIAPAMRSAPRLAVSRTTEQSTAVRRADAAPPASFASPSSVPSLETEIVTIADITAINQPARLHVASIANDLAAVSVSRRPVGPPSIIPAPIPATTQEIVAAAAPAPFLMPPVARFAPPLAVSRTSEPSASPSIRLSRLIDAPAASVPVPQDVSVVPTPLAPKSVEPQSAAGFAPAARDILPRPVFEAIESRSPSSNTHAAVAPIFAARTAPTPAGPFAATAAVAPTAPASPGIVMEATELQPEARYALRVEEKVSAPVSGDTAKPRSIEAQPSISTPAKPGNAATDAASIVVSAPVRAATSPVQPSLRRSHIDASVADIALATIAQPHAASPVTVAQNNPLDMGRHGWPQAMIERIEALRDAADAVDTSIRIVPDKLGMIDVSVRRDGDVTHVHFAAEQAQTRTILADAQPRLAELADSRGLKLGQSSIDGGAGQHQPQNRTPHAAFVPAAPARARPRDEAASTDHRIA